MRRESHVAESRMRQESHFRTVELKKIFRFSILTAILSQERKRSGGSDLMGLFRGSVEQSTGESSSASNSSRAFTIHLLPRSGFALAVLANIIWGTTFLTSKYTLTVWGPFTASALRFAVALVAMICLLPAAGLNIQIPKSKRTWLRVFLVGLTGFGLLYPLQLQGLKWIPSSLSASIMLSSPLFVLFLAAGFFGEVLSTTKLVAITLGIFGGIILISPSGGQSAIWSTHAIPQLIKGSFCTVLASLSLAGSVLATRSLSKDLDSRSTTFWSMLVGELILIPFAIFEKQPVHNSNEHLLAYAAILYLSLICSVFAFLIWNRAISLSSPQNLASTMHIKTPVAVILGVIIANEPLTFSVGFGALLISLAVWISSINPKRLHTSQSLARGLRS